MKSAAPNGAVYFFRYHDGETARCSPFLFWPAMCEGGRLGKRLLGKLLESVLFDSTESF